MLLFGIITESKSQNGVKGDYLIKPFTITIIDSDYSNSYAIATIVTEAQLTIIFKGSLIGEKDSIVYSVRLKTSETLRQISEVDIGSLEKGYSNDCVKDGSQITVKIKKGAKYNSVHLSNFYQEDVGRLISLVNSIVPDRYKIWYDKESLIADYMKCKGN